MGIYCKNCGAANQDGVQFCVTCGTPIESHVENRNEQQNQQVSPQQTSVGQTSAQQLSVSKTSGNGTFVSTDEYVVATLKNGMVTNLMSGDGLRNEEAVLTNRRLYYNHTDGWINISREEEKIDVADITGTKIFDNNPRGWLILAALLPIVCWLGTGGEMEGFISGLFAALVPIIIYVLQVKKHFKIEYAGGHIYFSIKQYNMKTVREFQKAIYTVKDSQK